MLEQVVEREAGEEVIRGQIKNKQSKQEMIANLYADLRREADIENGLMSGTGGGK